MFSSRTCKFVRVPNKYTFQEYLCSELNLKGFSGYCTLIENISLKFTILQRTTYLALFLRISSKSSIPNCFHLKIPSYVLWESRSDEVGLEWLTHTPERDFAPMLSCGKFNYKYFVYNLEHMLELILANMNNRDFFKLQETDYRVQIFQPHNYTWGGV